MGKPPAVVIIARHGARLDAADKRWHLTSPTPYDPPLTYGGWTQSRALGARIASLLQARGEGHEEGPKVGKLNGHADTNGHHHHHHHHKHSRARRRKHKVIIHTSPFVRCVQTAIAVSAGMAQYHRGLAGPLPNPKVAHLHSGSPHLHALDKGKSPHLSAIPEPEEDPARIVQQIPPPASKPKKYRVRIDAFLGEWLSPDYFENITPPPSSVMMMTGAKADLLRRAETIEGSDLTRSLQGHFPGGWGSDSSDSGPTIDDEDEMAGLANMANLGHSLPRRVRTSSHGDADGGGVVRPNNRVAPKISTKFSAEQPAYTAPVPTYAISPSDPIPAGYVAHARDACVNVDFQWDSMREPQDWGNGGDYGEEWGAMHKRFRNGLQKMIAWYKTHDADSCRTNDEDTASEDDDDTDTVLVLVTHGAGCNALIGALTNQPVLLDVGMASLTMAVRKDIIEGTDSAQSSSSSPTLGRKSSIDLSIANEYDVKLVASTEHLRAGSNPLGTPLLQSPKVTASPSGPGAYRQRFGSLSLEGFSIGEPAAARPLGGSLHRSSSAASATRSYPTAAPIRAGSGLWGSSTPTSESSDDIVPNFAIGDSTTSGEQRGDGDKAERTSGDVDQGPPRAVPVVRTASQRGLWGAAGSRPSRDEAPTTKRRWTVNDNRT